MKTLRPILALSALAFVATLTSAHAGSFDSQKATIQKGGAHTAKVILKKETLMAPITFEDGADWGTLKDHYEVDPAVVSGLEKKKISIKIGSDGKASFTRKK